MSHATADIFITTKNLPQSDIYKVGCCYTIAGATMKYMGYGLGDITEGLVFQTEDKTYCLMNLYVDEVKFFGKELSKLKKNEEGYF